MIIEIHAEGRDSHGDVLSLFHWLSDGDLPRSEVRFELIEGKSSGRMGVDLESITAVVGMATSLGSLIVSILAWRDARLSAPPVRLIMDGQVLRIQDDGGDGPARSAKPASIEGAEKSESPK